MSTRRMPRRDEERLTISQAARLLDRSAHTLRSWDRNESMPEELRPYRDAQNHRYWTYDLIDQIKTWIAENDFHPGRGIDSYHPSPDRLSEHMRRIRSSRANTDSDEKLAALKEMIEEAIDVHGTPPERIVEMLPTVIKEQGIALDDALRIAAAAVAGKRE